MTIPKIEDAPVTIRRTWFEDTGELYYLSKDRIVEILTACCDTYSAILVGMKSGYAPTTLDIACLHKLGEAIYLLRHKWWTRSEDVLGYCAFLGVNYDSASETVKQGYFPEGFSSVQSRASAQKRYVSSRREIYRRLRIYTSQILSSAAYAAQDDPRKELLARIHEASADIKAGVGLEKFADAEAFFSPSLFKQQMSIGSHLSTPGSDRADLLDIACAIEAHYFTVLCTI